jgi:hypothetical protein
VIPPIRAQYAADIEKKCSDLSHAPSPSESN